MHIKPLIYAIKNVTWVSSRKREVASPEIATPNKQEIEINRANEFHVGIASFDRWQLSSDPLFMLRKTLTDAKRSSSVFYQ